MVNYICRSVKKYKNFAAEYDRDNDKDGFEYGAEDESNIKLHTNQTGEVVKMTTTACFSDYHVDYAAFEFGKIEEM